MDATAAPELAAAPPARVRRRRRSGRSLRLGAEGGDHRAAPVGSVSGRDPRAAALLVGAPAGPFSDPGDGNSLSLRLFQPVSRRQFTGRPGPLAPGLGPLSTN